MFKTETDPEKLTFIILRQQNKASLVLLSLVKLTYKKIDDLTNVKKGQ